MAHSDSLDALNDISKFEVSAQAQKQGEQPTEITGYLPIVPMTFDPTAEDLETPTEFAQIATSDESSYLVWSIAPDRPLPNWPSKFAPKALFLDEVQFDLIDGDKPVDNYSMLVTASSLTKNVCWRPADIPVSKYEMLELTQEFTRQADRGSGARKITTPWRHSAGEADLYVARGHW